MGVQVGRVPVCHPTQHWCVEGGAQVIQVLAVCFAQETKDHKGEGMIYHKGGTWTYQDICDAEDGVDMWRFEKKGDKIFVKYPRKEKNMNDKFFDGAELFKLYAEQGLPLEMALMRIDQAGKTVAWPLFVQEAVRNGWNLKKTYTTIVAGVRDAEIYTKAQMVEFETMAKLFFIREAT